MTDVATTHAEGCWAWGQKHHACAVREIERLRARVVELEHAARESDDAIDPEEGQEETAQRFEALVPQAVRAEEGGEHG